MPWHEHQLAMTPPDETAVWRYLDLPKLLVMLQDKALYFALLGEMNDPWEAVIDRRLAMSIATVLAPVAASGDIVTLFRAFNESIGVNCWYIGPEESIAMWSLYTQTIYGVAIKSNVGRLKRAFGKAPQQVFLGRVEYRDHDQAPGSLYDQSETTPLKAILQKRVCYKHECELRAFAHIMPELPDDALPGQSFTAPNPECGIRIDIDLNELIESITLGPRFPTWARGILDSALSQAAINLPVLPSDAYKLPPESRIVI
jgi:hypothetical protein